MKKNIKLKSLAMLFIMLIFSGTSYGTKNENDNLITMGNWKSNIETCTYTSTSTIGIGFVIVVPVGNVPVIISVGSTETITSEEEGTRRRCVDGTGFCVFSSSCS